MRSYVFVATLLLGMSASPLYAAELPGFAQVRAAHPVSEAWLYDRNGVVLDRLHLNPTLYSLPWVPLQGLSPSMRHALLVSEDKRFYQHGGVDWRAVVGAAWENLVYDTHRGASTLTMQLAGLLDPALAWSPGGRSYTQKWDQIKAARDLERTWSKAEIFEAYLNKVTFRGRLSGINAAAEGLFNTPPSRIDKAQASLLAALLRGPNASTQVVAARACGVAQQLRPPRPGCATIRALALAHLSEPARLDDTVQLAPALARQFLHAPGDRVQSSLDAVLQRQVLASLTATLAQLKSAAPVSGEVLVLNNWTGEVLASANLPASDNPAAHPPRGMLQPFLYGWALDQDTLTPASALNDAPLGVDNGSWPAWLPLDPALKPQLDLRDALALNRPAAAARTLLLLNSAAYADYLNAIGLNAAQSPAGAAVTLYALTNAYRSLAQAGLYQDYSFRVGGLSGNATRSLSTPTAAFISDALADAARAGSPVLRGFAARKSVLSADASENWSVGFSDRYSIGVWLGTRTGAALSSNHDNSPAAQLWQTLFNTLNTPRSRTPRFVAELSRPQPEAVDSAAPAAPSDVVLPVNTRPNFGLPQPAVSVFDMRLPSPGAPFVQPVTPPVLDPAPAP